VADCCLEDYRDRKLENAERQADDLDETDNGDNILALDKCMQTRCETWSMRVDKRLIL